MALYGAGLRVLEACRLGVADIDSMRMVIHVREGKGGKDRFVMLSQRLLDALRKQWMTHRTKKFLFVGRTKSGHVSPEAVRAAIRKAASSARLTKRVTPHILRHCFATHLLEIGTDVTVIQSLLGHYHIRETSRYTRISSKLIRRVQSPLDLLDTTAGEVLG
jgi:integrase/recombinase XerD